MIPNTYLDDFVKLSRGDSSPLPRGQALELFTHCVRLDALDMGMLAARDELRRKYSFAIPDDRTLQCLANLGPLVEMGAGTGYWAYLLRGMGVDVLAYDIAPPSRGPSRWRWSVPEWTSVLVGTPEVLRTCDPARALFLCWPDHGAESVTHFQGSVVVHVGEEATSDGLDELAAGFELVEELPLLRWPAMKDRFTVWRRRRVIDELRRLPDRRQWCSAPTCSSVAISAAATGTGR